MFVYLSGGERRRAAVSSVILAVGPIVDGVTPAVSSEGLEHKSESGDSVHALSNDQCTWQQHTPITNIRGRFSLKRRTLSKLMSTCQVKVNTT